MEPQASMSSKKSLEEYRKQVEATRQILLARKGGEGGGGEENASTSTATARPPVPTVPTSTRTPAPPTPPLAKKKDEDGKDELLSSAANKSVLPLPPPSPSPRKEKSHEQASSSSSSAVQPPPPRSPRPSSFRRSRKLSNATSSSAPRGAGPEETSQDPTTTSSVVPRRDEGSASIQKPEASPRTKAKELIGETLANLRKRAQPFASGTTKSKADTISAGTIVKEKGKEGTMAQTPLSHIQTNLVAQALPAEKQKVSSSKPSWVKASSAKGLPTGGKGKGEVSALLQDASLAHKKVDALLEAEQKNKATENNVDIEGPQTQFVDRLYHSLAKLKHLEKSRNRMNLCADSMEASVKSLNQFVSRVDSERERTEKLGLHRKANAKAIIQTNASLLTTEISLLLRSYAVEQKQIEHIKGSISDFLQTVFEQMEKV